MKNLQKLFSPDSIAIIGASEHPEKVGHQILKNLLTGGFKGKLCPVNKNSGTILELPCYKDISAIKHSIDLAIIVIPAKFVFEEIGQCQKHNIKNIIVISAGFAETGHEGEKYQKEIAEYCAKYDINLLGPNCLGLITNGSMNASFAKEGALPGGIGVISQSGAIISSLLSLAKKSNLLGFSKIISLGNKALLNEADFLEYLYQDRETLVIIAYIEQLDITPRLTEIFQHYAKSKPLIILFGGRSALGAKAASSHTGSIVTSYLQIKTYLTQAGAILADDLEELLLLSETFLSYNSISGDRIAIITNAGGPAIAASDAVSAIGLKLAEISGDTKEKLKHFLPPASSVENPIDLLGNATAPDYEFALKVAAADKNIDGILVLLTPQLSTPIAEVAEAIANFKTDKPVISSFVGGEILDRAKAIIEAKGKPCFSFPENAVFAFSSLAKRLKSKISLKSAVVSHRSFSLDQKEAVLAEFDLPLLKYQKVEKDAQFSEISRQIGYPQAIKTAKENIHKTDANGLALDIRDETEGKIAIHKIGLPVIVGRMIKSPVEIFIGVKKDIKSGLVSLAFGTGGIYSEIYKDFSFRIAPVDLENAREMISETKMGEILSGARNQHFADTEKLAKILVDTGRLMLAFDNIAEIDMNPVLIDDGNFLIADLRIIVTNG